MLQTEFEFTLPLGYTDNEGNLHKEGIMRLSTAADEILPLKDPRVQANQAYLIIILFSRVVIKLGSLEQVNPKVIEGLYSADLTFLQNLYNTINQNGKPSKTVSCPKCQHEFDVEINKPGELQATP